MIGSSGLWRTEVLQRGLVARISETTLWRWLAADAIRPWSHHPFSVVQRKVLEPNNFTDLDELEQRLLAFQRRYEQAAKPFQWNFTEPQQLRPAA